MTRTHQLRSIATAAVLALLGVLAGCAPDGSDGGVPPPPPRPAADGAAADGAAADGAAADGAAAAAVAARPAPPDPAVTFAATRCALLRAAAASNPGRYAPGSPFRRPASCDRISADSLTWVARWMAISSGPDIDPAKWGRIVTRFTEWSVPRYDLASPPAGAAVTTVRVFSTHSTSNVPNGTRIPYSNAFRPSGSVVNGTFRADSDAILVIHDSRTGQEWRMWRYPPGGRSTMPTDPGCSIRPDGSLTGFVPGVDLCVGAMYYARDADGTEPGPESTGISAASLVAIGKVFPLAGLLTAEELARGEINHPLMVQMFGVMFGNPVCGAAVDPSGATCGYSLFPASRVENLTGPLPYCTGQIANTSEARRTTVPQGMHFALNLSDEEIEWWLNSRGFTGVQRTTMGRFARALRNYGFYVAATGCSGTSISMEGATTTAKRDEWRALGIDPWSPSSGKLLDGLIGSSANVVRLDPPPTP